MKGIDITGKKFGHLTVKKMLYNYNNKKRTFCLCDCDCGNKNIIRESYPLRSHFSELTSCGCTVKEKAVKYLGKNIDGHKFGKLTVLETFWNESPIKIKCKCDCGNIGIYNKNDVQNLHTKSCGCLNKEIVSQICTKNWTNIKSDCGVKGIRQSYKNNKGQWMWEFECPLCHTIFTALPAKVYSNHTTSCGCTILSSRERLIESHLIDKNISFLKQYSFDDCKYKYKLKFDFAILKENKVICLIEYDGQQHFRPVEIFGGEKSYCENIKRDKIKNEYCINNNIPLLRKHYSLSDKEIKEKIDKYILSVETTGYIW